MGKIKTKTHDLEEYYKGEIRKLRSINRHLERQLKDALKQQKRINKNEIKKSDNRLTCPECGKGEIKTLDLGIRLIKTCKLCGYKEGIKK